MRPGPTLTIEYKTWGNSTRTAKLEKVKGYTMFNIPVTTDPDFLVSGPKLPEYLDLYIAYLTLDGGAWASKCHSHTNAITSSVDFTFEHFHAYDLNNSHHEDNGIAFLAPDGTKWLAQLQNLIVQTGTQAQPIWQLQQLP